MKLNPVLTDVANNLHLIMLALFPVVLLYTKARVRIVSDWLDCFVGEYSDRDGFLFLGFE